MGDERDSGVDENWRAEIAKAVQSERRRRMIARLRNRGIHVIWSVPAEVVERVYNAVVVNGDNMSDTESKMTVGRKDDDGKARWGLLPFRALREVVSVLTYGSVAYGDDNWRQVVGWKNRYSDALYRHMSAYMMGEFWDPDTGLPHLAHVATNALFLLDLEPLPGLTSLRLADAIRRAEMRKPPTP